MTPARKAFYEYHASLMEPWDGPASMAFTDGTVIGAVLDRNGLRPSRYYVTKDDLVIMASEVGVLDVPPEQVLIKERLHPGRIFLVDTAAGRIVSDDEIKETLAAAHPYGEWLAEHLISIDDLPPGPDEPAPDHETVRQRQAAFGYTQEDLRLLLGPMASAGEEPLGSMGTDTPLAVLSERPRLLYDYFKQLFAQVTNPPLDAIREELVTSMESTIGPERNLLWPEPSRVGKSRSNTRSSTTASSPSCDTSTPRDFTASPSACCTARRRAAPASSARLDDLQSARARGRARWAHDPHPVRPRRERGMGADSQPAGDGGGSPSPGSGRGAHQMRPRRRIRRRARSAPHGAPHRVRSRCGESASGVRNARRHDPGAVARRPDA